MYVCVFMDFWGIVSQRQEQLEEISISVKSM